MGREDVEGRRSRARRPRVVGAPGAGRRLNQRAEVKLVLAVPVESVDLLPEVDPELALARKDQVVEQLATRRADAPRPPDLHPKQPGDLLLVEPEEGVLAMPRACTDDVPPLLVPEVPVDLRAS